MAYLRILVCTLALLASQERGALKVDVQLSQVVVTVTDTQGRYVTNLTAKDFTVDVGGVPQKIEHFTQDADTPVSIGIMIDTSLSMRFRLPAARLAASRFIHGMKPSDEFFLMTFAGRATTEQEFTQDRGQLDTALQRVDHVGMSTNLLPAVESAAKKVLKGKYRKRALIVISDGGNTSNQAFKAFRDNIKDAEVLMYSVQIEDQSGSRGGPGAGYSALVMRTIAADTGGRWFKVDARASSTELVKQFDDAFTQISAELRGQYSIGFYPSSKASTGRVKVTTGNPEYKVRFR